MLQKINELQSSDQFTLDVQEKLSDKILSLLEGIPQNIADNILEMTKIRLPIHSYVVSPEADKLGYQNRN